MPRSQGSAPTGPSSTQDPSSTGTKVITPTSPCVHRALSWLNRAEQADDADGGLSSCGSLSTLPTPPISMSTVLRAIHVQGVPGQAVRARHCQPDRTRSGPVRQHSRVAGQPYVFQSWSNQNGKISEQQRTERFASGRRAAQQALANRNTPAVLGVLFNLNLIHCVIR